MHLVMGSQKEEKMIFLVLPALVPAHPGLNALAT